MHMGMHMDICMPAPWPCHAVASQVRNTYTDTIYIYMHAMAKLKCDLAI